MPRSTKKPCTVQTSISSYFRGPNKPCTVKPAEQKIKSRKLSSDDFTLPRKRAKLCVQDEQVVDCEQLVHHSAEEELKVHTVRGESRLCSSTMEKLKHFSCPAESRHTDGDTGSVSGYRSREKASNHHGSDMRLHPIEEDQREAEQKQETSRLVDPQQGPCLSQFAKPGGRAKGAECAPAEISVPCRHTKSVYTPLEQQVVQLKRQHPDALLAVECGYKYRFFGEDAEIAAKELNIFCHMDHNFMTCSIPTHRLFVHVRRLVSQGHKVGVVKQTETSAIKASGANRNALFTRQLSALYTKSTLVGEDVNPVCSLGDVDEGGCEDVVLDPPDSFLLCISESWDKLGKQLTVGLVAVQPSTGDVLLDCFPDGPSRSELEGRILKVNPVEILVPSDLSDKTHRLLQSISNASSRADDRVRVEQKDSAQFEFASAMNTVTEFYCHANDKASHSLSSVVSLERPVICCLGPLIQYLQDFNLERILTNQSSFRHLSCESEGMSLSAAAIRNLEILTNQTDGGVKGSLLWVLDHTRTPFGRRLIRKWVSRPLTDTKSISERLEALQEILRSDSLTLNSIRTLLTHLPDLERGICSIYHKKSTTQEFYLITSTLSQLGLKLHSLLPAVQSQLHSELLRTLLLDIPDLLGPVHDFLKVLNEKAAKSGDKAELFSDLSSFPLLMERRNQIQSVLSEIQEHRKEIRKTLKAPTLDYVTVSGQEFLIEVKNSLSSSIPTDWVKISSTKTVIRYHSPFLVERYKKLLQLREQLLLDCQREWTRFLDQFGEHYHTMKRAISHLATVDCLFSLAEVAKQGGYCRPEVCSNQRQIMIRDGRHPAIDLLMGEHDQYVPNNTEIQGDGRRIIIVTGPNMGGKSSYIRQVALICIMAQIGSYVPACEARLGVLGGIYTRMGASDSIYKGRSTFMEELTEASEIISRATENSLVILDELGRGTSTHDGIAIAFATLQHFIRHVKSLTLFVTHYPPLCELEQLYPAHVSNYHMAFLLNEPDITTDSEGGEVQPEFITFLYQLTEGAAERSYGLNVARLAKIPDPIIHTAALKARELENMVNARRRKKKLLSEVWSIADRSSLVEWLHSNS